MSISVLKNNLCAGCGLCESVFGKDKISVEYNKEGYLRPNFKKPLTEKEVKYFNELCPGINAKHDEIKNYDHLWGPTLAISSGYANNEETRYSGSSGGALTAISTYLLEEGKVECIVHMGASETHPYRNQYKVSQTKEDLIKHAGSRYAPSATLINIVEILKKYSSIAVVGKPCDIIGVRNYMKKDEVANTKIKHLLTFMCAGVPSQKGTKQLIEQFKIKEENVVSLRYRGEGWPGYFKVVDDKQKVHKITYNESWGTVLNRYLQFRCKVCADGTGEFADITCADAWESSENGYPSFEEKKGVSLIITRTENGKDLLSQVEKHGYLTMTGENFSSQDIGKMQPYQKQRKQNIIVRMLALKLVGRGVPKYNTSLLFKTSLRQSPFILVKNFLGMIKRL
ncbi:Coenzyme F420 hydrogenase/dehydrogenase, beta subunit C-terminal domain [Algibacter pacificus]|uniref:Coenzyme F420 hydrogenase/dehydrogenase, beta subunit C-terminal domain n=1 Tax=Algibacter pacificus TaxID=2599389 RepID=UPI0011CBECC6|nr:Coenzyme F420 hydrogenase/dehydrogenase, beta subunit C-terminal domain [Algibacter pacificus]